MSCRAGDIAAAAAATATLAAATTRRQRQHNYSCALIASKVGNTILTTSGL